MRLLNLSKFAFWGYSSDIFVQLLVADLLVFKNKSIDTLWQLCTPLFSQCFCFYFIEILFVAVWLNYLKHVGGNCKFSSGKLLVLLRIITKANFFEYVHRDLLFCLLLAAKIAKEKRDCLPPLLKNGSSISFIFTIKIGESSVTFYFYKKSTEKTSQVCNENKLEGPCMLP